MYALIERDQLVGISPYPIPTPTQYVLEIDTAIGLSIIDNPRALMEYKVVGEYPNQQIRLIAELERETALFVPLTRTKIKNRADVIIVADKKGRELQLYVANPQIKQRTVYLTDATGILCLGTLTDQSATTLPIGINNTTVVWASAGRKVYFEIY